MSKVLVTGGAGFIGSHLVDRLVKEGYDVRVLDDLSTGKLKNIQTHLTTGNIEFVKGDIRDASLVIENVKDVNFVFHLAAMTSVPFSVLHPDIVYDVNLLGTLNLIQASVKEGVDRFVFVSSCAVCGDPKVLPVTETVEPCPISPYAESKLLGERYCLGFCQRQFLPAVILRFFNVYGPRQGLNDYSGVITRFADRVRQKEPLVVYGDGSQTRDFVNVIDIVEALLAAIKKDNVKGEIFNVGTGKPTSITELAEAVLKLTGTDLVVCYKTPRAGDIKYSYADISKAQKLLGYEPSVSLHNGLQTLLEERASA
jgi:UDP-glucose 4-epimerase